MACHGKATAEEPTGARLSPWRTRSTQPQVTRHGIACLAVGDRQIFQKLVAALASARPARDKRVIGRENRARFITDQPTVTIFWEQTNETRQLSYNRGRRDARYAELPEQLEAARGLLPVDTLIGER